MRKLLLCSKYKYNSSHKFIRSLNFKDIITWLHLILSKYEDNNQKTENTSTENNVLIEKNEKSKARFVLISSIIYFHPQSDP